MSRLPLVGLALVVLLLGCGGGGASGNPESSPVPAPSGLAITPGLTNEEFVISWQAPSRTPNGYELEAKAPGEGFTKVHDGLIPASYTELGMRFTTLPPEGTLFTFRLRASLGGQFSPYSNEATYEQGPNAPVGLAGDYDLNQEGVALSWTRNSTVADGCRLERATSNNWGSVTSAWSVLAGVNPAASTHFDGTVEKNSYYLYRVANLKGTVASASAISPVVFTGLPTIWAISGSWDLTLSGVSLKWDYPTRGVSSNLRVRIDRVESDDSGRHSGDWVTVAAVNALAMSFLDPVALEGAYLVYRITPFLDSTEGTSKTMSFPVQTALNAPANLRLTTTDRGIRLDWENQSQVATEVVVRRSPSPYASGTSRIALLGASTTTFEDMGMPVGYYTYWVEAQKGTLTAGSARATAPTANPANALNLVAGTSFQDMTWGAVRPGGEWVLGVFSPFSVRSDNDPWPTFSPPEAICRVPDFVRVDSKGFPHAVYAKSDASTYGNHIIVHAWFDGTEWKEEDVATTNLYSSSIYGGLQFTLDSTGNLHLLLDHSTSNHPNGQSTDTLTYLHKSGDAYVVEPLSTLSSNQYNHIDSYRIQVDGQDRPHLLLKPLGTILEFTKDKDGLWGSTTLLTGDASMLLYNFLDGRWIDPDNGWVFYGSWSSGGVLMGLQRAGGVWQAPVVIATNFDGQSTNVRAALSTDGTRLAVHHSGELGERLFHWTPEGWVGTLLAPRQGQELSPLGFDANSKLHLLLHTYDWHRFQEFREP